MAYLLAVFLFLSGLSAVDAQETPDLAASKPVAVDLSKRNVAISARFAGTDLLLFGVTDGPGEVAVTVTGPRIERVLREKERIGPIWTNRSFQRFQNVPAYYAVATSDGLTGETGAAVLDDAGLSVESLEFPVADRAGLFDAARFAAFRAALLQLNRDAGLFREDLGGVRRLDNNMFRVNLHFPVNVPVGTYRVNVHLLRDGAVVDIDETAVIVNKVGLGAFISRFARDQGALYGLAAILIAVVSGFVVGSMKISVSFLSLRSKGRGGR